MKLLLTSAGITNESLAASLEELVGKERRETKIGFVPTAGNVEVGNKDWFIGQLTNLHKFGFNWIDVVDISAPGVDWKGRLGEVDVVFVSGGNTFHLLDQVRKAGFGTWLKENLSRLVYVGSSAGSIITTPSIAICNVPPADVNVPGISDFTGMKLVDFEMSPHSPRIVTYEDNEKYASTLSHTLYAIDDQTGIEVIDGKFKVISEGAWKNMGE